MKDKKGVKDKTGNDTCRSKTVKEGRKTRKDTRKNERM